MHVLEALEGMGSPSCMFQNHQKNTVLLAPKSLHTENLFRGINLCNVIDFIYIMIFSRGLICVMH